MIVSSRLNIPRYLINYINLFFIRGLVRLLAAYLVVSIYRYSSLLAITS
ncbi:hypothetical protein GCM10025794_20620 [Massilia kyonggiensis]